MAELNILVDFVHSRAETLTVCPSGEKEPQRGSMARKRRERPSDDAGASIEETRRPSIEEAFAEAEASLRMKGPQSHGRRTSPNIDADEYADWLLAQRGSVSKDLDLEF